MGGGGFASVWRARTVGPGGFARDVAIKVMRSGRASQKRFQDMFLDEARLVARIQHPNVTQIWEVGEDPRSLYIVMELVEGESLDELRYRAEEAGTSLSLRAVFKVLSDVCAGLHAAHELTLEGAPLGLVHRDVSPQNILVSRNGTTKLIDFGIAKAKERLIADTTTGFIKGKIAYMAPEQARTEEIDRRADVWAIGACAYEIIEGKPPCDGRTDLGRLAALVSPAPIAPLTKPIPEPLRRVVMRALEKERDARHPTALALKEAIDEALIESELETSDADVAILLRPYFDREAKQAVAVAQAAPSTSPPAAPEAHSVERGVSSTIEAHPSTRPKAALEVLADTGIVPSQAEAVELPRHKARVWPIALAGVGVLVGIGAWQLSRASVPDDRVNTGAPSGAAIEAPASAERAPRDVGSARAEDPVGSPPPPPSIVISAPDATGRTKAPPSRAGTAPKVQGSSTARVTPPPSAAPTASIDENGIE